ncbi:MAG: TRAP transporter large permease [Pigmentiphaga sp.]
MQTALLGFIALFALAFIGVPLGYTMLIVGVGGFAAYRGWEAALAMGAQQVLDIGMSHGFSVIPLFVLMGSFIFKSGIADELFTTAQRWLGSFRGGLAHAALGASGGFGAVSGSSLATAATMARVAVPEMRRHGYDPAFSGATVAAGGTIGMLIPPSVPMVIFGILTETDIGKLFIAGIIPGILLMLLYMATVVISARRHPEKMGAVLHATWSERLRSLPQVLPVIGLFLFVFGGLYLGVFTPTESAGIGAAGALALMVARRRATWQRVREALWEAAELTAILIPVTIGAAVFGNFLTMTGLTYQAAEWIQALNISPIGVVLAMCVIYILLGCVFDSLAMLFLTLPIFFPIIMQLGLDPIWFGIVVMIVVELGLITPPVGMNVFVVKGVLTDVGTWQIFANISWFVLAGFVCLGLVIAIPEIATTLPSLMR